MNIFRWKLYPKFIKSAKVDIDCIYDNFVSQQEVFISVNKQINL